MATASLTINLSPSGTLVFSGVTDATAYGLVSLTEPAMLARTSYAPAGRWMHGSVASSATWEHTSTGGLIVLTGASSAAIKTAKAAVVAAISRLSYTVVVTKNGTATTWNADWGSLVPAEDLTLPNLSHLYEVYRLSIPVHPIAVS